jgi:hypothetical protein
MPTEMNRSRGPASRRAEVTPASLVPLAIIAILILVLHVAGSAVLASPQAHAAAMDIPIDCQDTSLPEPSLPFD